MRMTEIGRKSLGVNGLGIVGTGVTMADSQAVGTDPVINDKSKM